MRYRLNKLSNTVLCFAGICFVFVGVIDIFIAPAFFALIAGFFAKWIVIAMDAEIWPPSPLSNG